MNVGFMFSMEIGKTNSFANLLLSSFQPVKTLQTKSVFQHFFATRGHSGRCLEKRFRKKFKSWDSFPIQRGIIYDTTHLFLRHLFHRNSLFFFEKFGYFGAFNFF